MFLLVPACPGCPGQTAVKWLLCCCCCQFFNRIIVFLKCLWISQLHKMCIFPNYLMLMCISAAVSPCVVLCRLSVYGDTHLVMRFTARETYLCLRSMARKIRSISVLVACPPFLYTGWAKTNHTKFMAIILSSLNQFSKFFHWSLEESASHHTLHMLPHYFVKHWCQKTKD